MKNSGLIVAIVIVATTGYYFVKSGNKPVEVLDRASRVIQERIDTTGRGTVVDATGQVTVTKPNGLTLMAVVQTEIKEGDRLTTDGKSRCTVKFQDQSTAALGPNTDLSVLKLGKKVTARLFTCKLKLDAGRILMQVPSGPGRKSTIDVVTPSSTLGVRGTKFLTDVDESKTTRVAVFEGVVEVQAAGKSVSVAADQGTLVKAGEAPLEPVALLAAPVVDAPKQDEKIKQETIPVRFSAIDGAKGYVIEMAKNPEMTHITIEVTTDKTTSQIPGPATDGPYYLRVSAVNTLDLEGARSEVRTIYYRFRMKGVGE